MGINSSICRICVQEDFDSGLICPCLCRGTIRKVHPECMEYWAKTKQMKRCEICKANLNIVSVYPSMLHITYQLGKCIWHEKKKNSKVVRFMYIVHFYFKTPSVTLYFSTTKLC